MVNIELACHVVRLMKFLYIYRKNKLAELSPRIVDSEVKHQQSVSSVTPFEQHHSLMHPAVVRGVDPLFGVLYKQARL